METTVLEEMQLEVIAMLNSLSRDKLLSVCEFLNLADREKVLTKSRMSLISHILQHLEDVTELEDGVGQSPTNGPSSRNLDCFSMSSDGQPTSPPQARPSRQCQAPKHLEDYILDSHHRPALSSSPVQRETVEQRGAAAAVYTSQADADSSKGGHRATPSPSQADLLSMDSLTKLMESMNEKEKEETVEMDNLLKKLDQLRKRKHRRDKMMEHIKSFLREEQETEDNEQVQTVALSPQSSSAPSSSSSPLPFLSRDTVLHVGKQADIGATAKHKERSHRTDVVPEAEVETHNRGFVPVQPSHPQTTGLVYSPISSGTASPVSHVSQPQKDEHVPSHLPKTLPSQERAVTHEAERIFQPLKSQQLISQAPAYPHAMASYGYLATPFSQTQPVNAPTTFSYVPSYQRGMPSTLPSQNMVPGLGPSVSTAAAAQLMPVQIAVPPGGNISQRTLYSPPKPKIPDFTSDSEREFANMKLALDNLLEPYPELTEKYKYHVLLEHLKLPEAQMIGQSCRHHPYPYSAAMQALQLQYGQPHQLAQSEIASILTSPDVKRNDNHSFQSFALRVHLLVSMLLSLEGARGMELNCCSHVDRLLSKLPKYLRDGFIEFLQQQGKLNSISLNPYNLQDFAGWLQVKAQQQRLSIRLVQRYQHERLPSVGKEKHSAKLKGPSLVLYHGASPAETAPSTRPKEPKLKKPFKFSTWKELVEATRKTCQQVTDDPANTLLIDPHEAELILLRTCQAQSFPEETTALSA
ncbi:hypothetical protein QQF64_033053 [Cirrhinus molitorella]|uniref:Uncharacterized protein n=1 Tax=Cirrhinus molitorella TaxID=172907 RepID=A0ABR3MSS8_9TELE